MSLLCDRMPREAFRAAPRFVAVIVVVVVLGIVLGIGILAMPGSAAAKEAAAEGAKSFSSPSMAAQALVNAAKSGDKGSLLAVLGPEASQLISSGDEVADKNALKLFVKEYETKHALVPSGKDAMLLEVGSESWSLPLPIVKSDGAWHFDATAGKEEILYRRIGHNELGAIAVCKTFVDLQREYAETSHDGLPPGIYAQKLRSEAGKQNGLYWETKASDPPSPAGPLVADASAEGYGGAKHSPYHGYYYRILTSQGSAADGGVKNYLVDGSLKGGFALLAYPAEYGLSGIKTFLVNQNGIVYEKDLGEQTADIATHIDAYDPDKTWSPVH